MKLRISRSQKSSGMVHKSVMFALDARVELTPEEQKDVKKYELAKEVIYNSEASRRHLETSAAYNDGTAQGLLKSAMHLAMAKMKLNITIGSLVNGHHIEAKSLDELKGAENRMSVHR